MLKPFARAFSMTQTSAIPDRVQKHFLVAPREFSVLLVKVIYSHTTRVYESYVNEMEKVTSSTTSVTSL